MPIVKYPNTSYYAATPQTPSHLGRAVDRAIPAHKDDREITVESRYHNRPDRLAHDLYGTDDYFWVFQRRNLNLIRDPFFDLRAGMKIVVPSANHLRAVLG